MKTPKMILFDYGFTLLHEPDFNTLRGEKALFNYVTENPRGLTPEEADSFSTGLFKDWNKGRDVGCERHERQFQRLLNEYLELNFSIDLEEQERIYFENLSPGGRMPGVEEMLADLKNRGIRSGVISNIGFSERVLKERIDKLLPKNSFEFIIASSEYGIRKPDPMIFNLALRKARLLPEEVWFCGDSVEADVAGAYGAGIHPVWYENLEVLLPDSFRVRKVPENCPGLEACTHIHCWSELTELLTSLSEDVKK